MHGEYATVDGRPVLQFERRIHHPVDAVWRALTEPDELAHWFPTGVEGEFRAGAPLTFTFREQKLPDESPASMTGEVTEFDPPRLLAFDWGGDHLRFELEQAGEDCVLRFTVGLETTDKAARDSAGWHVCLDRLEQSLDGADMGTTRGESIDDWRSLYDEYVRRGMPVGAALPEM